MTSPARTANGLDSRSVGVCVNMVNDDCNQRFPEMLKRDEMTMKDDQASCPRFRYPGRLLRDDSAVLDLVDSPFQQVRRDTVFAARRYRWCRRDP